MGLPCGDEEISNSLGIPPPIPIGEIPIGGRVLPLDEKSS
jgi:hypothetical protein